MADVFNFAKFSIFDQIVENIDENELKTGEENIPFTKTVFLHVSRENKEREFLKLYRDQKSF